MKNVIYFLINTLIIFSLSKLYLKGYKFKPKKPLPHPNNKTHPKPPTNKTNHNISTQITYDYSLPIYLPQNVTCDKLGIHTWALLHSAAATYPNHPTEIDKERFKNFFDGLIHFYPSHSELIKEILEDHPIEYNNREELVYYICLVHNLMNQKLGKPKFSCRKAFDVWGGDCGCND